MHKEVITEAEFNAAIATGKVLVDFWATWCGPCAMMGQKIESEIVPAMADLTVVKVNVDNAPELCAKFGIVSIPTLLCYVNGERKADFVGVTDVATIKLVFEG